MHQPLAPRIGRIVAYLVLTAGALVSLVPFIWMVSTSLKPLDQVFVMPPQWIPDPVRWDNYTTLWQDLPMGRMIWNSVKVSVLVVIGQVIVCATSAYAFARLRFPGRELIFGLYLASMMIPGQVTQIPSFMLMRVFGWIDTHYALIIPGLASAFGTFLLRQFLLTIPVELEEAARIDGANYWHIFAHIMLPLSRPALATLGVFTFMGVWNDFMWPLITINSLDKMTLPLGLSFLNSVHSTDWTRLMAGDVIALIPVVVVFLFAQRYFIHGITLTGLKG